MRAQEKQKKSNIPLYGPVSDWRSQWLRAMRRRDILPPRRWRARRRWFALGPTRAHRLVLKACRFFSLRMSDICMVAQMGNPLWTGVELRDENVSSSRGGSGKLFPSMWSIAKPSVCFDSSACAELRMDSHPVTLCACSFSVLECRVCLTSRDSGSD